MRLRIKDIDFVVAPSLTPESYNSEAAIPLRDNL